MSKISLVIFDLSGTTIEDNNRVAVNLHRVAREFGLQAPLSEFEQATGTNKIHLYEYVIARERGQALTMADFRGSDQPDIQAEAVRMYDRFTELMLAYYRENVQAMPGAEETFQWCHEQGIKVATDTGFHRDINEAIMQGLDWRGRGLVDLTVDVESTGGVGRPAPYMIFHAMQQLGVTSVHEVIKIGDTPADLLSGYQAGCRGNIGVLSGANPIEVLGRYMHTHILPGVQDLPELIESAF